MSETAHPLAPAVRRPLAGDRMPVVPSGVPYLLQALHDESLTFAEIARAIERLPSVAGRLLALANSAWSAPASTITSIEAACGRLGLRVVRTTGIALAVSQPFNPAHCPGFDALIFWQTALLNAEAAHLVAQRVLREERSTARTAALLANLGLLWLAEAMPEPTDRALRLAQASGPGHLDRHLAEQGGIGYVEAGSLLAEAWQLPSSLRHSISSQLYAGTQNTPLSQVVSAAIRMGAALRHGTDWAEDLALVRLGADASAQRADFVALAQLKDKTCALAEALFGRGC